MGAEPSDFALEAFKALRAEIDHYLQAMAAVVGVGLTAVGAIGAFGLSQPGNREALLVLPLLAVLVMAITAGVGSVVESKELAPGDHYPYRRLRPPRRPSP